MDRYLEKLILRNKRLKKIEAVEDKDSSYYESLIESARTREEDNLRRERDDRFTKELGLE